MSDKETIIKETKLFLEDAQKGVLKALNSETSFLSRLFSGSAKESLKLAQSSISRALNQVRSLKEDESSVIAKLQKRISERDDKIKSLETKSHEKDQSQSDLKDKIRQLEAQLEQGSQVEAQVEENQVKEEDHTSKIEESLRETIAKLEDRNNFLTEKLQQNETEMKSSNELILEFSSRMKRLKSEITSK